MKKLTKPCAALLSLIVCLSAVFCNAVTLDSQVSSSTEEIYPGVVATEYYLAEGGYYSQNGPQFLRVVEFDPKRDDLAFDMVMAGDNVGALTPLSEIVDNFNKTNTENKTVIAAVNGDLWTQASHHSRVEGESDDPVVKKELCIPRGYNVADGEIITTTYMTTETPVDDFFYSFGVADDGTAYIGQITTTLSLINLTSKKTITADGLNRLPANDSLVVYSDKGPISNYALDDAYEVVIDFTSDYTIKNGTRITGKVTAISEPGDERYSMQENRIILTARGSNIEQISDFNIGDRVTLAVRVTDLLGNTEAWQNINEACGGHVPVVLGGEACTQSYLRADPMTLIGFKADGNIVMIVNDGRQEGYSIGINRLLYEDLCLELGLDSAFLLDGGGSTTLVELTDNGYALKNRPSDYHPDGVTHGYERPVANAVLLSYIDENKPKNEMGDIDGSGAVNSVDLFKMKLFVKQTVSPTQAEASAADVNSDSKVNTVDLFHLKFRIMKGFWGI